MVMRGRVLGEAIRPSAVNDRDILVQPTPRIVTGPSTKNLLHLRPQGQKKSPGLAMGDDPTLRNSRQKVNENGLPGATGGGAESWEVPKAAQPQNEPLPLSPEAAT